jgi:hypothetical protein
MIEMIRTGCKFGAKFNAASEPILLMLGLAWFVGAIIFLPLLGYLFFTFKSFIVELTIFRNLQLPGIAAALFLFLLSQSVDLAEKYT